MQEYSGVHSVTLRRVWADYQQTRPLKPSTLKNYNQRLNMHLKDWLDLPVAEITKEMVEARHAQISGKAMANSTFRTLRALLHYASFKYEDETGAPIVKSNPVRRLSELRAWHRDKRRRSVLTTQQLKPFLRAVFSLDNSTTRDLFLLILLTGMRRQEAMTLRWEQIDCKSGTIRLLDTKNGEDCVIPMSTYIWNVMILRHHGTRSPWVFPGRSPDRHISGGHKAIATVIERSGVSFCLHDLRRTFITVADEIDIKSEVVKALVNHKSADVTEGYTVRSIERLRRAAEKISTAILHFGGMGEVRVTPPR